MSARYLTLPEASALISTPLATLRFWIQLGRLQAFRPGRRVLVREADLVALIEGSAVSEIRIKKARAARKGRAA